MPSARCLISTCRNRSIPRRPSAPKGTTASSRSVPPYHTLSENTQEESAAACIEAAPGARPPRQLQRPSVPDSGTGAFPSHAGVHSQHAFADTPRAAPRGTAITPGAWYAGNLLHRRVPSGAEGTRPSIRFVKSLSKQTHARRRERHCRRSYPPAGDTLGTAKQTTGQYQGRCLMHIGPIPDHKLYPTSERIESRVSLINLHTFAVAPRQETRPRLAVSRAPNCERRVFLGPRHDLVREPDAGDLYVWMDERRLQSLVA